VHEAARDSNMRIPHVGFKSDRIETFWEKYADLLRRIRTERDDMGRYLIYPWEAATYTRSTTENIVKMWHTIQASWDTMRFHAGAQGISYTRVAMLRNDVVYVTPIDIYEVRPGKKDEDNRVAVVPGFGRYPISDRMIYGPAHAVEIWASHRFKLLDKHVKWVLKNDPGEYDD